MTALAVRRLDPRKLDAWLAAMRKPGDVARWELVQLAGRNRSSVVRTFHEEHADQTLAADALETAQQDADDTSPGAPTTYALVAQTADKEELSRYTMRLSGRPSGVNEAGPEEEPTVAGLVGAFLRKDEALARLRFSVALEVADSYRAVISDLTSDISRKGERIKALEDRLDKSWDDRANLADRSREREAAAAERKMRAERSARLFQTFMTLLPMLIAGRAGAGAAGRDVELEALVKSLRPEQLFQMTEVLDAPQQIALAAILKKYVPPVADGTQQQPKEQAS